MIKSLISDQFWTKLFVVLNTCFVIFGIILFGLGIKSTGLLQKYPIILYGTTPIICPIAIFLGCLILTGTVIGYIGLWKPKQFIAIAHIVCLSLAVIIEIAIAAVTIASSEKFHSNVNKSLLEATRKFYSNEHIEKEMDRLQNQYRCCGAGSYLDYIKFNKTVPFSCLLGDLVYARGCTESIDIYVQHYIVALICLCFTFGLIKAVYLAVSIVLLKRAKQLTP
ncbi:unnamed protein product [Schistosoma turkestanicum]|nr:unnamed protein product [Schistosoma turkestanicum]